LVGGGSGRESVWRGLQTRWAPKTGPWAPEVWRNNGEDFPRNGGSTFRFVSPGGRATTERVGGSLVGGTATLSAKPGPRLGGRNLGQVPKPFKLEKKTPPPGGGPGSRILLGRIFSGGQQGQKTVFTRFVRRGGGRPTGKLPPAPPPGPPFKNGGGGAPGWGGLWAPADLFLGGGPFSCWKKGGGGLGPGGP